MKLTEVQQRIVAHRGSHLLVAASAGAGKTEVLARRCAALLADETHPCRVEQLLVVTFTRAAAAELRSRVARMLRARAAEVASPELRRHLRRQELLLDAAEIGTIDAWCGRLVREHFSEAGVDVNFRVLAPEEALLLRRRVLGALFDEVHSGAAEWTVPVRAWLGRTATVGPEFLRDYVTTLQRSREQLLNPESWLAAQRAPTDAAMAAHLLAEVLAGECRLQREQLSELLAGAEPAARDALTPFEEALADWAERAACVATAEDLADLVAAVRAFRLQAPRGRTAAPQPAVVGMVRERWLKRRLQARWDAELVVGLMAAAEDTSALTQVVLDLEARFQAALQAEKRQQNAWEFGDVQRCALDLLGAPVGLQERVPTPWAQGLRRRYAHVLVDEYQDTSPIQVALLELISVPATESGNRFMVGDIKQSIYGFREAEPRLFAHTLARFESGVEAGCVEYLSDNFRSHAAVLEPLNHLFERLFERNLGGTSYGPRERLRAGREAGEGRNPTLDTVSRVQIHIFAEEARTEPGAVPEDESVPTEELPPEIIEREALFAAREIHRLLAAGVQVPERGASGAPLLRPLRLGDIVILLRSAAQNAGLVARTLRDQGLPCAAAGRESLFDCVEVGDLMNILRLLVNRQQDVALAAYLRSPAAGLTAADLLAVRTTAGRTIPFHAAVYQVAQSGPSGALVARLGPALQRLDEWETASRHLDVAAVLRLILRDTALLHFAQGLKGGDERVARLRALQQHAESFAASQLGGVAEFCAYLDELRADEIDLPAATAGDDDMIRILTIHGAKGLEFPVVFLLACGARFNRQGLGRGLHVDVELGLGVRFCDYARKATLTAPRHFLVQQRLAQRELEEELRLLYVAATRARELLYFVGHAKAEAWDEARAAYGTTGRPPLLARLAAGNRLDWLLMAAAAQGPAATGRKNLLPMVQTHDAVAAAPGGEVVPVTAPDPGAWTRADEDWLRATLGVLRYDSDSVYSRVPAALSVSAAKEIAQRERGGDRPQIYEPVETPLPVPGFVRAHAEPEGRTLGTACHRFLEQVDLARLTDIDALRTEQEHLVAVARLPVDLARLVPLEDLAWFAAEPIAAELRACAGTAQRELAFVYALPLEATGEFTIVRGVIDCLFETPAGLALLDYKTDRPRDTADFAARVAAYTVQLQLYAQAAAALLERPVRSAALVFLRERRMVDVPIAAPPLGRLFAPSPTG
ncbi:MAG: UvrD-helicase domain-containing protein [Phycisphaerales bacterium]|nr:UvrD-helicase domain-containing protein [Phycisphaerales bacterium]